MINRREFIKVLGSGAASVYFAGCAAAPASERFRVPTATRASDFGPFDRTLGDVAPKGFSGDHPSRAHEILWHKAEFIQSIGGKLPDPGENADLVVVGGGMSGLLSAYFLRDRDPIILEQAERFGGNSRGESWRGIDYSLATAYFNPPEKGSEIWNFFEELGFNSSYRVRTNEDPIFIDGKRYDDIWSSGTVPESKAQFVKLQRYFTEMFRGENGLVYPDLPIQDESQRPYIDRLDRISFKSHLEKVVGGPLHNHVEQVIEHYFWSAVACSSSEISAACGLNFFASDFAGVAVAPGGNGAIAEAVLKGILKKVPSERLRPSSLVFDVRTADNSVVVTYLDARNQLKAIRAKTAIMSCPKFVAAKLIDEMEPARKAAISRFRYRAYLVANALVERPIQDSFYDLFFFDRQEMHIRDIEKAAHAQRATDLVYGNFAKPDLARTVLTIFRGMPYDHGRHEVYERASYERFSKEFEEQIRGQILPMMKIPERDIVDVRIARWGHPLPVPDVGNIAERRVDEARKPYRGRVFFVEQDNWTLPGFEVCFHEARTWAPAVVKALGG